MLPLVLVGLTALGLLALAAFDTARFGRRAARAQADAAAALHAADSALELYLRGVGPTAGPLEITAEPGAATLTVLSLVDLEDGSVLAAVSAAGRAPAGATRPVTRRLEILARLDPSGVRERVAGSWAERF
ncbi:MAG: hypothetical protein PVF05_13215 [Gemmatimonadales bacterium]